MGQPPAQAYCDYCRLPRTGGTVTATVDGEEYRFCSEHCRSALADTDRAFTRYHGHRRFQPGVAGLDAVLPQGCPRNSFVLLSAQPGTRDVEMQAELVWRALLRGEPAAMVTFLEPPASLVERFATLDWNVLPFLESGKLRVVDCFTYRFEGSGPGPAGTSAWTEHLAEAVAPATERVRDPTDVAEVFGTVEGVVDDLGMVENGLVVVDSLTEFGSLVQPVRAYDFVKDLRANVSKARFVPVIAGGTLLGDQDQFPHDLAYVADGVVDAQVADDVREDDLVRRVRVRKLSGVRSAQRWTAYEYVAGDGMVTFQPRSGQAEPGHVAAGEAGGAAGTADGQQASDAARAGDAGQGGPDGRGPGSGDGPR